MPCATDTVSKPFLRVSPIGFSRWRIPRVPHHAPLAMCSSDGIIPLEYALSHVGLDDIGARSHGQAPRPENAVANANSRTPIAGTSTPPYGAHGRHNAAGGAHPSAMRALQTLVPNYP